jgi:hypothetical protein
MRLRDIITLTQSEIMSPDLSDPAIQAMLNKEIRCAFGADLMSDALFYDMTQGLLITGLINPQVVRTAEMADVSAILMVRGKTPLPQTISLAKQIGIPIIGTQMTMFETCGRLYTAGLGTTPRHDSTA